MFLVPHVAEGAPTTLTDGELSDETTPVFSQHFPLLSDKKAGTAVASTARPPSGRLGVGASKRSPRPNVRSEACRKVNFEPKPPSARSASFAGAAAEPERVKKKPDVPPAFLSHEHVLRAAQQPARSKPAGAAASLVERLTTPSRDWRLPAVTFVWRGGGERVSLVGSFTGWRERVPMAADARGAFFVTLHLRAGEHHYAFEVNGALCIADEERMCEPTAEARAPVKTANARTVDDGAEFEEEEAIAEEETGEEAAQAAMLPCGFSQDVPAVEQLRAWLGAAPPALPPQLGLLHGVRVGGMPRRSTALARPADEWHSALGHAAFAIRAAPAQQQQQQELGGLLERLELEPPCDGAGADSDGGSAEGDGSSADGDSAGSGSEERLSPPQARSVASSLDACGDSAEASTSLSVAWRWRAHRVTTILYRPAPAAAAARAEGAHSSLVAGSEVRAPAKAEDAARAKPARSSAAARAARVQPGGSVAAQGAGSPRAPAALAVPKADAGVGMWFDAGCMGGDDGSVAQGGAHGTEQRLPFAVVDWMAADLAAVR